MYGTARGTGYGYSLWEFEVYGTVPPPTGLTAAAANSQVSLSWDASPGATSYNVKSALVSGGTYATIANVATSSCTNSGLVNGTTYYYVISALNTFSESTNSPEVSATPVCTPPLAPTASNNGPICQGMTLNLTASTEASASYNWTGPNGFSSALQNPSIPHATTAASGTYSVTATIGGCASAAGTTAVTVNPPVVLSIVATGSNVMLNWQSGTLQSATNASGPWNDVGEASPPFTLTPTEPQCFYRVLLP